MAPAGAENAKSLRGEKRSVGASEHSMNYLQDFSEAVRGRPFGWRVQRVIRKRAPLQEVREDVAVDERLSEQRVALFGAREDDFFAVRAWKQPGLCNSVRDQRQLSSSFRLSKGVLTGKRGALKLGRDSF